MFISLDKVKEHLNIDQYFHDDDEYLNHLILVAEKVVEKHIDCDFSVLQDEVGMIPAPLLHSMLLFIGNMYQSRESVTFASATELPHSFGYLLDLYMDYSNNMDIKPDIKKPKVEVLPEKPHHKEEPEYAPLEPLRPHQHKHHDEHNHHTDMHQHKHYAERIDDCHKHSGKYNHDQFDGDDDMMMDPEEEKDNNVENDSGNTNGDNIDMATD